MAFEVPMSDVARGTGPGGRRTVAAALLVLLSVVTVAIATGGMPAPGSGTAAGSRESPVGRIARPAAAPISRTVPAEVECRDVGRATCLRMAIAAMGALPDDAPEAVDATVWRSLLCNDNSDCPPSYLDGSVPLGSVIIRFVDGSPRAAVNVVEGRTGPIRRSPRAWVVRWMPEAG